MTTRTEAADPRLPLPGIVPFAGRDLGRAVFAFSLTLLAVLVLALAFLLGLERAFAGRVPAGVSAAGVPLAGLTRAEAEARLRSSLPRLDQGALSLSLAGERKSLSYQAVGRDYDLAVMLDRAMSVGRTGSAPEQLVDQLASLVNGSTVAPLVRHDAAALEAELAAALEAWAVEPVDSSVALTSSGTFAVQRATEGRHVERATALSAVTAALDSPQADLAEIRLEAVPTEAGITTAEAQAAADSAARITAAPLEVAAGEETLTVEPATLRTWIAFAPTADGGYEPVVKGDLMATALEPLAAKVERPARNARFEVEGTRVVRVIPATDGRKLDLDASARSITQALLARDSSTDSPVVQLASTGSSPALTTDAARAALPKMERLSSWTTYYPVGEKNFWGKNITIPTTKINGTTLAPGEKFDFWAVVGNPTRAEGYGDGGAIINGRTEPTGALAGGICSCSTTIFNAAARAGLEMGDRRNHYYYISRYPVGLDATVFKSSSGSVQNMTFVNDTDGPILIRGLNAYGAVTFEVYGIDDGRSVAFSNASTSNYRTAKDTEEPTRSLPAGTRKRVEVPTNGFDAFVVRTVKTADGTVLHHDEWFSRYAVIDGIVQVGRG